MAKVALLVGNANFTSTDIENLSSPVKDVFGLEACLINKSIGNFDEVISMCDEDSYSIRRKFHSITNKLNRDDTFLFYYSGHGQRNCSGNLNLLANDSIPDEVESSSVDLASLFDFIRNSAISKVIIILDCCYSGAISGVNFKSSLKDSLKVIQDGSGTYLMTASTGIQTASEFDNDEYSLFTKYLIEGLETGAADKDKSGVITLDELYEYVYSKVRSSSSQIPTKWSIDCRGVIHIAKSMFVPREERMNRLKPILLELLQSEKITTSIFTKSLNVAESNSDDLSIEEQKKDQILGKLLNKELKGLDYVIEWTKLEYLQELNNQKDEGKYLYEQSNFSEESNLNSVESSERATDSSHSKQRRFHNLIDYDRLFGVVFIVFVVSLFFYGS